MPPKKLETNKRTAWLATFCYFEEWIGLFGVQNCHNLNIDWLDFGWKIKLAAFLSMNFVPRLEQALKLSAEHTPKPVFALWLSLYAIELIVLSRHSKLLALCVS